jgi:hypothetical protein
MLPAVPGIQCVLMAMHAARFQHYNQATLREPASSPSVKSTRQGFPECNTRARAIGEAAHGEEAFPECLKIQEKEKTNEI